MFTSRRSRILLPSLILATILTLATSIQAQDKKPPTDFEIHYSKGTKAFDEGRIDEAVAELKAALEIDTQSIQANYILGIIIQQKGEYKNALKKFNVVYKKNKTYKNLYHYVALCYYKLNKDALAEKFFNKSIETSKDEAIKNESHFYLAKVYERMEKQELAQGEYKKISVVIPEAKKVRKVKGKRWFFNAYTGLQHDTNVALLSQYVTVPPDLSGKAAPRLYIALNGGVVPVLKKNMALSASYTYYHGFNLMNGLSNYNINQHTVSLDSVFAKTTAKRTYKAMLSYDYQLNLISNDFNFYNQSHIIQPGFLIPWSNRYSTKFRVKLSFDDFYFSAFPEDNRDALLVSTGFEETFTFPNGKTKIYLGFDYERNLSQGYNFHFNGFVPSLGMETPLWWITRLNIDTSYSYRHYVNYRPFPPRRKDHTLAMQVNLNKKITEKFEVNLNETFIYNESITGYTYKRNIVSLIFGLLL